MPEARVDLHCHSSGSSGAIGTPYRIAAVFRSLGYRAFALTDHDSFDSLPAACDAARREGLECLSGVELSVRVDDPRLPDTQAHILGYLFTPTEELRAFAGGIHARYVTWVRSSLERLRDRGVADITEQDLRAWIAQRFGADDRWKTPFGDVGPAGDLLRQRGVLGPGGGNDAVRDLFNSVCPPEEQPPLPTAGEACAVLARAGAVRVLAHPGGRDSVPCVEEERRLRTWMESYVDGIEAYTPKHTPGYSRFIVDLVAGLGRPFTGGSDRHDYEDPAGKPSDAPYACVESLKRFQAESALRPGACRPPG